MEKDYISRQGHARLVAERVRLHSVDRPKIVDEVSTAAAQGDRSENAEYIYGKKKLREIDRRMRWLDQRLEAVTVVDADAPRATTKCYFGAHATIEDEDGNVRRLRILGVDEADADQGVVSFRSPMGRALLGKATGDSFVVKSPSGDREYTLTDVQYGPGVSA